jgi:hypothetical protein
MNKTQVAARVTIRCISDGASIKRSKRNCLLNSETQISTIKREREKKTASTGKEKEDVKKQ